MRSPESASQHSGLQMMCKATDLGQALNLRESCVSPMARTNTCNMCMVICLSKKMRPWHQDGWADLDLGRSDPGILGPCLMACMLERRCRLWTLWCSHGRVSAHIVHPWLCPVWGRPSLTSLLCTLVAEQQRRSRSSAGKCSPTCPEKRFHLLVHLLGREATSSLTADLSTTSQNCRIGLQDEQPSQSPVDAGDQAGCATTSSL